VSQKMFSHLAVVCTERVISNTINIDHVIYLFGSRKVRSTYYF